MNRFGQKFIVILLTLAVLLGSFSVGDFLYNKVDAQETSSYVPGRRAVGSISQESIDLVDSSLGATELLGSGAIPVQVLSDKPSFLERIAQELYSAYAKMRKVMRDVAYKRAITYFFNKIAYDTATYIATGDQGKKPLFITDGWDKYLEKAGDEALGEFVNVTMEEVWGIDMCNLPDPLAQVDVQIRVKNTLKPTTPDCTWSEILAEVDDARQMSWSEIVDVNKHVGTNSEFGAYVQLTMLGHQVKEVEEQTKVWSRMAGRGYEDVKTAISEEVKTPSVDVEKTASRPDDQAINPYLIHTGTAAADAIGLFMDTLVSKSLKRIFEKGRRSDQPSDIDFDIFGGIALRQAAREEFAEFAQISYSGNSRVDLTSELSMGCGMAGYSASQYCETIDANFAQAIEEKLTLSQAINIGLINGEAVFGFEVNKRSQPSYLEGVPYDSMLILRKFRIIPVGWELAAQYYEKYDLRENTISLNFLIGEYDNPDSPYYRLVDPEWQLLVPETRCAKEGYGPVNLSDNPAYVLRMQYCADYKSCVAFNDKGTGCAAYGYCLEEKPIWKLKGDKCVAYYSSCLKMTNSETKEKKSFLTNTLTDCNQDGCKLFFDKYDPTTEEFAKDLLNAKHYQITEQDECKEKEVGCKSFIKVTNYDGGELNDGQVATLDLNDTGFWERSINIKVAPDEQYSDPVLSCQGYNVILSDMPNRETCEAGNHYWRDDVAKCVESGNDTCSDYAESCNPDDMGCEMYIPESFDGPTVPAKIERKVCLDADYDETLGCQNVEWHDECPAECVGMASFIQEKTYFDDPVFESFIPRTAKSCSEPGCDQFTNLDEVENGGEGVEYYSFLRQCVKPDEPGVDLFYTWEGSEEFGYQLRKWNLLSTGNEPQGEFCSIGTIDIDCRQFYNPGTGQYYNIDFKTVVFADEDCHPFRRSEDGKEYFGLPSRSVKCSRSNVGCRTYKSNSSYNYEVLMYDDFESGGTESWVAFGKDETIDRSRESVQRGGYSVFVDKNIKKDLGSINIETDKNYILNFVYKKGMGYYGGNVNINFALIDNNAEGADSVLRSQDVTMVADDWQTSELDLGVLSKGYYESVSLVISASSDNSFWLDFISLKESVSYNFIKKSWKTDQICLDNAIDSCQTYSDSQNEEINLQKFSHLCTEGVIGCKLLIGKDDNGDRIKEYYAYTEDDECDEPGCRLMAQVTRDPFDFNNEEDAYYSVYPVVVAENKTCLPSQERCSIYQEAGFFLDPQGKTCTFSKKDGKWYTPYTDEDGNPIECPRVGTMVARGDVTYTQNDEGQTVQVNSEKHCLGGKSIVDPKGNTCSDNSDCVNYYDFSTASGICTSWVGVCPNSESGCLEYQDPFSPNGCDLGLLPEQIENGRDACDFYWYQNVEECNINDENNPEGSCAEFNDTRYDPIETKLDIPDDPRIEYDKMQYEKARDPINNS